MPSYKYAQVIDSTHLITHIMDVPFEVTEFPDDGMSHWLPSPDEAKIGDAVVDGVLYPHPDYDASFDAEAKAWTVNAMQLQAAKDAKISAIDARTQELIKKGFEFAGKRFSMSESAQRNWIALSGGLANNMLPFPMVVSTVNEESHVLASANELKAFLGAYLTYQADPSQPLGAGRTLKERIAAAATIEELEAIVDERQ